MKEDLQPRQPAEEQLKSIISDVLWGSRADGESLMEFLEKHETDGQPLTEVQLHKFAAHWVYRLALCNNVPVREEPEKFMLQTLKALCEKTKTDARKLLGRLKKEHGEEEGDRIFKEKMKAITDQVLKEGYQERRGRPKGIGYNITNQEIAFLEKLFEKYEPTIKNRLNINELNRKQRAQFFRTVFKKVLEIEYETPKVVFAHAVGLEWRNIEKGDLYGFLVDDLKEDIAKSGLFKRK